MTARSRWRPDDEEEAEAETWKTSIKTQWAELADTLGQTGVDILAGKPLTVTAKRFREPKVLAIMLMSRTLSNLKGKLALIENGLVVEARILVRCCFENAFWLAGLGG